MTKGLITLITNIQEPPDQVSISSACVFNGSSKNASALQEIGNNARRTSAAMMHVNRSEAVRQHTEGD